VNGYDVLSRDLIADVVRHYGSLRRFHEVKLAGRLSYYKLRLAVTRPRPAAEVRLIEAAAADVPGAQPEVVRGLAPSDLDLLRTSGRRLWLAAVDVTTGALTYDKLSRLRALCDELRPTFDGK